MNDSNKPPTLPPAATDAASPLSAVEAGSTPKKAKKPKIPFAQRPFSHLPPYQPEFAERVPVLEAFNLALANYVRLERRAGALPARMKKLFQAGRTFTAAECGVFTGNSLLACASLARDTGVPFELFGLDTFTGLPELSATDRSFAPPSAAYLKQTWFTETSVEAVAQRVREAGLARRVHLVQGLFADSLPRLPEHRFDFVNIDCDLYEPHIECLEYFYPRMVPGGVVFFDDYHSVDYPMAAKAVDAFMKDRPEKLQHLRFGEDAPNRTKAFFIKH